MYGGMNSEVEVRRMTRRQTREAALLHTRELPHEFLTRFGPDFLSSYYRAFVDSPHAVALAASADGERSLDGVLIGTFDTGAHYSHLVRRHGPRLAFGALRQALRRPALATDILRTRLRRYCRGILRSLRHAASESKKDALHRELERVGFVAYVAVDERRRGHGIGGRLFEAYEELAREAGLQRLELVTLPDERGAAPFFDKLGYRREGEITSRSGERYAFYTRSLKE